MTGAVEKKIQKIYHLSNNGSQRLDNKKETKQNKQLTHKKIIFSPQVQRTKQKKRKQQINVT